VKLALLSELLSVSTVPIAEHDIAAPSSLGLSSVTLTQIGQRIHLQHLVVSQLTETLPSIYSILRPHRLLFLFSLHEQEICAATLHLCQGKFLQYNDNQGIDEQIPVKSRSSVRAQASRILKKILKDWSPARVLIGTGNPDTPEIINSLTLPLGWEKNRGALRRA
jgi:hypothetical protein